MDYFHDFNLWLTYHLGSEAVVTPIYAAMILIALAIFLCHFLREGQPSPLEHPRLRATFLLLIAIVLGSFSWYAASLKFDERLDVAEKMLMIREHGGASLHRGHVLSPAIQALTDRFAWFCSHEKDPWSCVKSRAYHASNLRSAVN